MATTTTYTKIKVKCSGPVEFESVMGKVTAVKVEPFASVGKIKPFPMKSYKPRTDQFCNGSSNRQKEILDMMISPGIVRGLKTFDGVRYLVDGFKSFVEGGYKAQFGQLAFELDKSNKFVRAIINEPFLEDLEKSINPLFRQSPSDVFDWMYLPDGGNKNFSTVFLSKGTVGQDMCFYYGTGIVEGTKIEAPAGYVSNLFYQKSLAYDVVANETGYLNGPDGIEQSPDDIDRGYMEKFRFNPICKIGSGLTIFGNWTGQRKETAQSQIQNSELLCFIKESLYSISRSEAFKKGLYNDYLRTETECTNFMSALALSNAIEPNYIVICNASNNTPEIQKKRIKLVHIEYTPVNCLDKIVFDLTIN